MQSRVKYFPPVIFGAVLLAILYFNPPAGQKFYPRCPFNLFTHLSCPGCGALRAGHQLLHGNFLSAFHFNPLLLIALPFLALMKLAEYFPAKLNSLRSNQLRPIWIWLIFAVMVSFTVMLNLPGFAWLGPN